MKGGDRCREPVWLLADVAKRDEPVVAIENCILEPFGHDGAGVLLNPSRRLERFSGIIVLATTAKLASEADVRDLLGLTWSWREQKLYDLFWSVHNIVYPVLPRFVRFAHARLVMRDFRRRMRKGKRVI